jgi:hypothetical protein
MTSLFVVFFQLALSLVSASPPLVVSPTEPFTHHEVLDADGHFHLFWKYNATHVTFEIHVHTHGYVGFGLSPSGNMYPADIMTAWIRNGRVYLQVG